MSFIYDEAEVQTYPTIALRGIVVFPGITTSFELGRKLSISSLKLAAEQHIDPGYQPFGDGHAAEKICDVIRGWAANR